jgi:hypothetical protein
MFYCTARRWVRVSLVPTSRPWLSCRRTGGVDPYRTFGPRADPATSTGRLMLTVLGEFADVERDLIRTRTAEGRSPLQAQGAHGPPARAGRDVPGIGAQLQRQPRHHFTIGTLIRFCVRAPDTKAVAVKYSCSARRRRSGWIDCLRPWFIVASAASI